MLRLSLKPQSPAGSSSDLRGGQRHERPVRGFPVLSPTPHHGENRHLDVGKKKNPSERKLLRSDDRFPNFKLERVRRQAWVQAPETSASEPARQAWIATDKEKLVALEAWSCMTIQ